MLQCLEAIALSALFLERANDTLDHAVLLRAVRRDELLAQPVASHQGGVVPTGKRPSVPNRAIKACSSALDAVLALPLRDRRRPNSSRVWQSMTRAIAAGPDPAQIGRPALILGALATDGSLAASQLPVFGPASL